MVTPYIPFRNEEYDLLAKMKFIGIYDQHEQFILQQWKKFDLDLDIDKTIEICRNMCRERELAENQGQDLAETDHQDEPIPFLAFYHDQGSVANSDMYMAILKKLGAIAKRENLMDNTAFYERMRRANPEKRHFVYTS